MRKTKLSYPTNWEVPIFSPNHKCPVCNSEDISKLFYINTNKNKPDIPTLSKCKTCKFESNIPFDIINKAKKRDNKIDNILNGI